MVDKRWNISPHLVWPLVTEHGYHDRLTTPKSLMHELKLCFWHQVLASCNDYYVALIKKEQICKSPYLIHIL